MRTEREQFEETTRTIVCFCAVFNNLTMSKLESRASSLADRHSLVLVVTGKCCIVAPHIVSV